MIKATIVGAHTRQAGELLRILVNHPDVEIVAAVSREHRGEKICSVHYGLIGEDELRFSETADMKATDLVFLAADEEGFDLISLPEHLKIIDMRENRRPETFDDEWIYGLSELFRKPLVRGARMAIVPSAIASVALVGLYPLAAHLMLNSDLKITAFLPESSLTDSEASKRELKAVLSKVQQSFNSDIEIEIAQNSAPRTMKLVIEPRVRMSVEDAMSMYDSIYDDHRFTHLMARPVDIREISGTQKSVISFSEKDGELRLEVIADPLMRGGAGEAVHLMNLLFGLLECTGLKLMSVADN